MRMMFKLTELSNIRWGVQPAGGTGDDIGPERGAGGDSSASVDTGGTGAGNVSSTTDAVPTATPDGTKQHHFHSSICTMWPPCYAVSEDIVLLPPEVVRYM